MDRRLRRAVLQRLAAIEDMALRAGSQLPVRVARSQLKTITGGWRDLLSKHQPDRSGRCPICSGWLRRRRWPCQVWMTAHEHLIGDKPQAAQPARGPARKDAGRSPRPRQVEVIPRQVEALAAADHDVTVDTVGEHIDSERTATSPPPITPDSGTTS